MAGTFELKPSFEELRRKRQRMAESNERGGGGLFERDWEVFVARYDKDSGKYLSRTLCCETALTCDS
ncbi:MAG: hypothetical protein ABIV21_04335 [Pyrinomonadaceae bacterium]